MKAEEHEAILNDIALNMSDPAKVTSLLSQLRNDYHDVTTNIVTNDEKLKKLEQANKDLQQYNMALFLERGVKTTETTTTTTTEDKKRSFDELDLSGF
jgi:hypothetical protein